MAASLNKLMKLQITQKSGDIVEQLIDYWHLKTDVMCRQGQ
jgi:hypothetical protein